MSERKGPLLEHTNRRYKRTLIAVSNDPNDGPETVLNYSGCPTIGSTYALGNDADAIAMCIDVKADPMHDYPLTWKIEATYDSSRIVDLSLSNPLNLPPEITWNFVEREWPLQRDALGVPTCNSAGERIDPPLTIELTNPVLTVSRNEANFSAINAFNYNKALNSDNFAFASPLQARINHITGQLMCDIGIAYWKVSYEIEFQARTFALLILDMGFRDIEGNLFLDRNGKTLANATLMNGNGYRHAQTYCNLAASLRPTDLLIQVTSPVGTTDQPWQYFPPGPKAGTPNWYFEIMIDDEVMQVTGGFGTNTWNVTRGYGGTTPAAHTLPVTVYLQPYYLRFMPTKALPFAALNLPTIGDSISPIGGGG